MARRAHLTIIGICLLTLAATLLVVGLGLPAAGNAATVQASANTGPTAGTYATSSATPAVLPPELPTAAVVSQALPTPTVMPSGPVIAYFTCEPCVVEPGGSARLSWDLSGATAAYLDGQGVTAPSTSIVYPDQTTTYRLVAVNDAGRSEKTVTVQVRGLPTIHYFTCLPCEIARGESSTLSWDLSGATAAYLDGHGVPAPGNTVVAPSQTTTYRLVAVSQGGSVERLATVTVKEGGDPESVTQALRQPGYDVRWVGDLPLAKGGQTIGVIMPAASRDIGSQALADQYSKGFNALYDNYPGQILSVGLYDNVRYIWFVTAGSAVFEAFLRGELDGQTFWQVATWNVWDDWTARWLESEGLDFAQQDFVSKSFGF